MNKDLLIDLLDRALTEEMGLIIKTNNPHQLELQLHEIRKRNSKYNSIVVTIPSTPETVILVKKSVNLNTLEAEND